MPSDLWQALLYCCSCGSLPSYSVGGKKLEVLRVLGEGGFAFVYLVKDRNTGRQYALKKIRCPFGAESVANAMKEVDASRIFSYSRSVISLADFAVRQEEDGSKSVLILLPYYANGSLQDKLTDAAINNSFFSEREVISMATQVARALRVMHKHRSGGGYHSGEDEMENGENEALLPNGEDAVVLGDSVPYAHRDLKPANVMIDEDGTSVVLMDLGSCSPAKVNVDTRQKALELQDLASEHCTLPYRAPELLDVRTGVTIDEKVDIWSYGCLVYALMYTVNPFEHMEMNQGANLSLAVAQGRFDFPADPEFSDALKALVRSCINVDAKARPSIDEIIHQLNQLS